MAVGKLRPSAIVLVSPVAKTAWDGSADVLRIPALDSRIPANKTSGKNFRVSRLMSGPPRALRHRENMKPRRYRVFNRPAVRNCTSRHGGGARDAADEL